ncbi:MAG TPA: amidohydrolase [Thermoanaerobaculia bacterium]|nr:amidohydrolase [Thermoanaerobaculia bacterium]
MPRLLSPLIPVTLLAALLLLAAAAPSASQDAADLVLRHGRFYPVSSPGAVEGSLAVRDGAIRYLGPDSGVAPWIGPETRVLELGGRAVTPGLIDAHSHLLGLGLALERVDLRGVDSFDEVVRRVVARAAELPAGTWIQGRGWDQNLWPGKAFPAHQPLSEAVAEHPVWVTRIDGHAALVNSLAMRRLGIDAASEDPPAGRLLRDDGGAPTGVLVDRAMEVYGARVPNPTPADVGRALRAAADHAASLGLTAVTDMGVGAEAVAAYRALLDEGMPVRAALFWSGDDPRLEQWLAAGPWRDPSGLLSLRGVKLYADGALGSRGAALLEPYADDPGNLGLVVTSGAELERLSLLALQRGFQVGIHAIGDRGNVLAVDAVEAAFGHQPRPEARFRIEHAQIVRRADLERMGRLGILASMQPTHATSDMPWVPDRLGDHRLDRAYPWRTALDAGARLALGSDFPVELPSPLLGLYSAVTRQDPDGRPEGGWLPDELLTREEALRGFTLDAAYSLFLDDLVGTLETGKRADLVVWDRDPMQVPAAQVPGARVDWTVMDGRVVYQRQGE